MLSFATTIYRYRWLLVLMVVALLIPTSFAFAGVAKFFYDLVQSLFGYFVGAGGAVLNYAVNYFVIGFGQQFSMTFGGVVDRLWATVRDIFNLTFIFGLVYIGFKMILRSDDGNTRRWLVQLIIAALLVNFSLFITKFVIDFSNILAVQILSLDDGVGNQVFLNPLADDIPSACNGNQANCVDFSRSMIQVTNLVTVNDNVPGIADAAGEGEENIQWQMIFGVMILYLVTAFVFFSAGILLIIRGVVLIVLMILSPFLFLGMVLPLFQSFSRGLWKRLFSQAFMAPIYIILMYLTLVLAGQFMQPGQDGFANALLPEDGQSAVASAGAAFGSYIIVIALMLGSLSAAKKMGAEGAGMMIKAGQGIRKKGQRFAGGYAARGMNRAAARYQKSYDRAGNTRTGRIARNLASVASFGALSDRGIKAAQSYKVKGEENAAEKDARTKGIRARSNAQARSDERSQNANSQDEATRARNVANMTPQELVALRGQTGDDWDRDAFTSNARFMSENQINSMETDGLITAAEADNLRNEREGQMFESFNNTIDDVDATAVQLENALGGLAQSVENMTDERLVAQDEGRLTNQRFARHLSNDQMDTLRQSRPDIYDDVRAAREAGQIEFARTGRAPGAAAYTAEETNNVATRNQQRLLRNAQSAGEQPVEVFQQAAMRPHITPQAVEQRILNGASDEDLEGIRDNITAYINGEGEENFTPQMREQRARVWRQWNERSQNSGRLGLDVTAQNNTSTQNNQRAQGEAQSEGGIILDGSESSLRRSRDIRDSSSQDDLLNRNN